VTLNESQFSQTARQQYSTVWTPLSPDFIHMPVSNSVFILASSSELPPQRPKLCFFYANFFFVMTPVRQLRSIYTVFDGVDAIFRTHLATRYPIKSGFITRILSPLSQRAEVLGCLVSPINHPRLKFQEGQHDHVRAPMIVAAKANTIIYCTYDRWNGLIQRHTRVLHRHSCIGVSPKVYENDVVISW